NSGLIQFIDEDVRGFEVAMKNAALMRIINCLSNLLEIIRRQLRRKWILPRTFRQALALDEVHREIMLCFTFAHFMNSDDVRMLQVGGGLGFGLEALDRLAAGKSAGQ